MILVLVIWTCLITLNVPKGEVVRLPPGIYIFSEKWIMQLTNVLILTYLFSLPKYTLTIHSGSAGARLTSTYVADSALRGQIVIMQDKHNFLEQSRKKFNDDDFRKNLDFNSHSSSDQNVHTTANVIFEKTEDKPSLDRKEQQYSFLSEVLPFILRILGAVY